MRLSEARKTQKDEGLFERLYQQHVADVFRYFIRRAPRSDVDDLTAETFTIAWRQWSTASNPSLPWLYAIARNVLSNASRRRHDTQFLDTVAISSEDQSVIERDRFMAALDSLSDADQELLRLASWEALTLSDIAITLNCSSATASVRLHRARSRFEEALERYDGGLITSINSHRTGEKP